MKKNTLTFAMLLLLIANSFGQLSVTTATKKVTEFINELQIGEYLLYQNPDIVKSQTTLATFDKSFTSTPSDSWVFFLDKNPLKGWSHPCSFLFVDANTGKITSIEWKLPPNNLDKWNLLTEIKEESNLKSFDFSTSDASLLKSGLIPANCYAVIISGGYDKSNNWQRYWNDCSAIYSALVDVYNYEDEHIYTIIADGINTANDRRISGGYDSSPLDLDGDGDNDIQFSATRANITSVFNTLSGILDSDDYLFIFVTDHGDQESGQDALIYLWGETIRDDQFATEVNKVSAGEISIVMEQCYSGGFVDDLSGVNRVIATACDFDETSCGMGFYTYDEFVFDWIAAVAGEDPNGNSVDADDNNDGFVSMQEAFNYAESNDACSETPQYNSNKYTLGENLTLLGKEICISTDFIHDETINANRTIEDCNVDIDNVTIENNANVTIEAEGNVIIHKNFEAKVGTTLEIK
ncbi:MAG: caspase family protein [Candidatus Delongbacteria bacterium]|nr:caspase family protein [Candidatus Delongbacteria bacterium]